MESPNSSKEFEITGVSRSGRVRKKSSKLLDFRSPDDIEPKLKKSSKSVKGQYKTATESGPKSGYELGESDEDYDPDDISHNIGDNNSDSEDEVDDGALEDDADDTDENSGDHTVHQSLYMSEKSNKKKIYKDGKVVVEKAQRKDKGKTRLTAYMLWARDVRKNVLNKSINLDFANTSRKLGEMWANVPGNEKTIWRRRAKRLANKTKQIENEDTGQKQFKSTFINRATTSRTKKIAQQSTAAVSTLVKSNASPENQPSTSSSIFSPTIKIGSNIITQPGAFKVTGIEPIDVAAHLKLLGDSLSIIGERLKEHEGQITVSGSLSVLLDSLLCSLGPLICLTTQIPGLENRKALNDNLHATLDNIAYVMPGL